MQLRLNGFVDRKKAPFALKGKIKSLRIIKNVLTKSAIREPIRKNNALFARFTVASLKHFFEGHILPYEREKMA